MKKVFISYARKDDTGVDLVPWLQERLTVSMGEWPWVDRSSLPSAGQSFRATLVESVARHLGPETAVLGVPSLRSGGVSTQV